MEITMAIIIIEKNANNIGNIRGTKIMQLLLTNWAAGIQVLGQARYILQ